MAVVGQVVVGIGEAPVADPRVRVADDLLQRAEEAEVAIPLLRDQVGAPLRAPQPTDDLAVLDRPVGRVPLPASQASAIEYLRQLLP